MVSTRRKTFVAREDLLNGLSRIAKERGFSLYDTVNEIFELVLRAEDVGMDLKSVVLQHERIKMARDIGFILGLESLWYELADVAYEKAKDRALKSWFQAGVWFAKRYISRGSADAFSVFQRDLLAFTWNAPEFIMEKRGDGVFIRVISPRFSESYTFLFSAFLEGALDAFGYIVAYREVGKGIIRLEAVGKEVHAEG
jgi:hypothetical protein